MERHDFYPVADKEVEPVFPFFALSVQQLYHLAAKMFKMYPLNIPLFKKYSSKYSLVQEIFKYLHLKLTSVLHMGPTAKVGVNARNCNKPYLVETLNF